MLRRKIKQGKGVVDIGCSCVKNPKVPKDASQRSHRLSRGHFCVPGP